MSEVTCKGSVVLGTACGTCSRCKEEYNQPKITHISRAGTVDISVANSPSDAPNYNKIGGYESVKLTNIVVVKNGTAEGRPTVDLVFEDAKGQKHVALVIGSVFEALKAVL